MFMVISIFLLQVAVNEFMINKYGVNIEIFTVNSYLDLKENKYTSPIAQCVSINCMVITR